MSDTSERTQYLEGQYLPLRREPISLDYSGTTEIPDKFYTNTSSGRGIPVEKLKELNK